MHETGPLVSTQWLAQHLQDKDIRVIDASWRMPNAGHAHEDYLQRHIPGAVFFDIDAIADVKTDLPHMLPSPETFGNAIGALGIGNEHCVVVYDDAGVFSAPRVWWTFRAMGHERVCVLNGGLPKWRAEGLPLSSEPTEPTPTAFKAQANKSICATHHDIRGAILGGAIAIADARPAARFRGETEEPRPGLRSGAMPDAVSVPFASLIENGEYLEAEALKARFLTAGLDLSKPVITTCGSGVTAAVTSLALNVLGHADNSLYDGAWAEWADKKNNATDFPVITERDVGQTS